jgi:hypothetical protein
MHKFVLPNLIIALSLVGGACAKDPPPWPTCTTRSSASSNPPPVQDCRETCNGAPNGVNVGCAKRFLYGVNYAWSQFGVDFGGIAASGAKGISQDCDGSVLANLRDMRQNGVDVVRWWIWPQFRGDGVQLNASGEPTGLGGTALADLEAALDFASQAGVHVQLCLFSFDNFRTELRGLRPIVVDVAKRAALMERVVRPFVRAAMADPHADRLVSWDVINEPEWAISGQNPYGDPPYTPQTNLQTTVTHPEMEAFVADTVAAIRQESNLPITVGSAGAKWARAWQNVNLDFYTIHIYDWLNRGWPYDRSPAQLGITGKPVVMGEFPLGGLTDIPYTQMLSSWYDNGYAGAMGWSFSDAKFNWPANKPNVRAFADAKGCLINY